MDHMTFENDHTEKLESMILQKFLKGADFFSIAVFEYCGF